MGWRTDRQDNGKCAALIYPWTTGDKPAVMRFCQMFADGQPNPTAAAGPGTGFVDPVKSFKYVGKLLRSKPDPTVPN